MEKNEEQWPSHLTEPDTDTSTKNRERMLAFTSMPDVEIAERLRICAEEIINQQGTCPEATFLEEAAERLTLKDHPTLPRFLRSLGE